ncbi:MAG TPA: head GIN domain-containing protein [Chitinophagaceae bacterium]|nr:head GIN domain-containing protein [Chitinophagaceae bacterium]
MKKIFGLLFIMGSIVSASAQKTINDANVQKRNVSGFHAIHVSGGIDLYLSQGDEAVAVSASKTEYRDKILTEVTDGVLKIWIDWKSNFRVDWNNHKAKAYVSVKNLDGLKASGGSDVSVDGTIKTTKLDLGVSGGSDFKGTIESDEIKVNASGGSDVSISGKAARLTIDASGGSDFNGYEFAAEICNVEASGGSDVRITVNKELSVNVSGGSDVYYKGNGLIRDLKSSGSGIKKVSK